MCCTHILGKINTQICVMLIQSDWILTVYYCDFFQSLLLWSLVHLFLFSLKSINLWLCLPVSSHHFLTTFVFDMLPFCLSFCFPSPNKLMRGAHLRDQGCVRTYLSHYHLIIIPMSSLFIYLPVSLHIISSLL